MPKLGCDYCDNSLNPGYGASISSTVCASCEMAGLRMEAAPHDRKVSREICTTQCDNCGKHNAGYNKYCNTLCKIRSGNIEKISVMSY